MRLRLFLQQVLAAEAPIHEDVLLQRLLLATSLGGLTPSVKRAALRAIQTATVDGKGLTQDSLGFLRVRGATLQRPRLPRDGTGERAVRHLPPEELDLVVSRLRDGGDTSITSLTSTVARLFNWEVDADVLFAVKESFDRVEKGRSGGRKR